MDEFKKANSKGYTAYDLSVPCVRWRSSAKANLKRIMARQARRRMKKGIKKYEEQET